MDLRTKLLLGVCLGVCLPIVIWTAIFFIQVLIGHFNDRDDVESDDKDANLKRWLMSPPLIAVVGGVLGLAIGFWLARQ